MTLKVTISVTVQDSEHDRYGDPNGFADVDMYCTEIADIDPAVNQIGAALLKVADLKYKAETAEKSEE